MSFKNTAGKNTAGKNNASHSSAISGLSFDIRLLRFCFCVSQPLHFPAGGVANRLRGGIGKAFIQRSAVDYSRWFAPTLREGPSGLHDPPRPFVLRVAHLEGAHLESGETYEIRVNLFDRSESACIAMRAAVLEDAWGLLVDVEDDRLRLSLAPADKRIHRVRVYFVTATELKGADGPEFGVLFSRIRDRVSILRALYGEGPLEIDFRGMGRRASEIRMTRCDLGRVEAERVSRHTGQRHGLGGFVGVAEYEGDLAEFAPYLEVARWTGAGRQTVWGKGEIAWEEI